MPVLRRNEVNKSAPFGINCSKTKFGKGKSYDIRKGNTGLCDAACERNGRDADNSCDQGSRLRTDAGDEYNRKTKDDDYR